MIKAASMDDVRRIGEPLWLLINCCSWDRNDRHYDLAKAAALGIVAHLAYCALDSEAHENPHRARVVPCIMYQRLALSEPIDLVAVLAGLDFADATILRTRRFVAVAIRAREVLLIGVRGTQFAYDWWYNLRAYKKRDRAIGTHQRLHAGFSSEATRLAVHVRHLVSRRPTTSIYFGGHSLGGAIAAIACNMGTCNQSVTIDGCYTFGSPRIAHRSALRSIQCPLATRRPLDLVPHCPPWFLGYADFPHQFRTDGMPYAASEQSEMWTFIKWLARLAFGRIIANHGMESYADELIGQAKRDPRIERYWSP